MQAQTCTFHGQVSLHVGAHGTGHGCFDASFWWPASHQLLISKGVTKPHTRSFQMYFLKQHTTIRYHRGSPNICYINMPVNPTNNVCSWFDAIPDHAHPDPEFCMESVLTWTTTPMEVKAPEQYWKACHSCMLLDTHCQESCATHTHTHTEFWPSTIPLNLQAWHSEANIWDCISLYIAGSALDVSMQVLNLSMQKNTNHHVDSWLIYRHIPSHLKGHPFHMGGL